MDGECGVGLALAARVASADGSSCRKVHARAFLQAEETPTCGNRIETSSGALLTKDAIVLRTTGNGELGEIDQVVGGTGQWAGATGTLTGTGTFIDGVGEALLVGEVCTP